MMVTVAVIGFGVFLGCFLLLMLVLPRQSPGSALLEEVTREPRASEGGGSPPSGWQGLDLNQFAKPFTFLRSFLAAEPNPDLVRRLWLAGYRNPAHADIFLGARMALPALTGLAVALLIQENVILFFILALVVGFFLPDFWLAYAIKRRRERIRLSLPDGLDFLTICMEAGLGLDQGILRVGQELRLSHPELSEELLQINFEQRAGVPRIEAWKALADRVDLESVRAFVAMLIQTDRFGTPISRSLGIFSDTLRTQRRQQAEEMAAKTTIKLVPPLVFLILPEVFIVTLAPAIILLLRNMSKLVE
jgi:tight adherence protein C